MLIIFIRGGRYDTSTIQTIRIVPILGVSYRIAVSFVSLSRRAVSYRRHPFKGSNFLSKPGTKNGIVSYRWPAVSYRIAHYDTIRYPSLVNINHCLPSSLLLGDFFLNTPPQKERFKHVL